MRLKVIGRHPPHELRVDQKSLHRRFNEKLEGTDVGDSDDGREPVNDAHDLRMRHGSADVLRGSLIAGFVTAPFVLRRMAWRASGCSVAVRP